MKRYVSTQQRKVEALRNLRSPWPITIINSSGYVPPAFVWSHLCYLLAIWHWKWLNLLLRFPHIHSLKKKNFLHFLKHSFQLLWKDQQTKHLVLNTLRYFKIASRIILLHLLSQVNIRVTWKQEGPASGMAWYYLGEGGRQFFFSLNDLKVIK